jgi:hypothetical protein
LEALLQTRITYFSISAPKQSKLRQIESGEQQTTVTAAQFDSPVKKNAVQNIFVQQGYICLIQNDVASIRARILFIGE